MRASDIMREVEAVETLVAGEALYYHPGTGTVQMGRRGCQTGNTLCLRVGPDHVDGLDLSEIREAVEGFLGRHDAPAPAEPDPPTVTDMKIHATVLAGNLGDGWRDQNAAAAAFAAYLEGRLRAAAAVFAGVEAETVTVDVDVQRDTCGAAPLVVSWDDEREGWLEHDLREVEGCAWEQWCGSDEADALSDLMISHGM